MEDPALLLHVDREPVGEQAGVGAEDDDPGPLPALDPVDGGQMHNPFRGRVLAAAGTTAGATGTPGATGGQRLLEPALEGRVVRVERRHLEEGGQVVSVAGAVEGA